MDCSFEEAVDKLTQIPRLFIEPDGSFVWTGNSAGEQSELGPEWHLFGMLYDVNERLNRVELQGTCPIDCWQALCSCLQPDGQLVAFLLDFGCFVMAGDLNCLWG